VTKITIGSGVTDIESDAFNNCWKLTKIIFQGAAPNLVANNAFTGVPNTAVAYAVGSTSFGETGQKWNGLTVQRLLTWTTTDGDVTITDCYEDAGGELIIPEFIKGNFVTNIDDYAFQNCSLLTSVIIPDSVVRIEDSAFRACSSLANITIGNGVTSIGNSAFYRCRKLRSAIIPNNVIRVSASAFESCTSLTNMTIPDAVTSIGDAAFYDCTSLTSITFQGVAPTVGKDAFSGMPDGAIALVTVEALNSFGEINEKWNGLTLRTTEAPPQSLEEQLAQMTAERDAAILERDTRPTQAAYDAAVATARTAGRGDVTNDPTSYNLVTQTSYNTVVAERDARFTEDQIRTMSVDHTVGQNEAGNMQVKIAFVQSTDLNTYIPFTVTPDSLSVVDGKICMEFPPSDAENFFFRFGFHNPEPAIVVQ
jgi:hypothetical protein